MPSQAVIGAPGGVSTIAVSARASSRSVAVLMVHGFPRWARPGSRPWRGLPGRVRQKQGKVRSNLQVER